MFAWLKDRFQLCVYLMVLSLMGCASRGPVLAPEQRNEVLPVFVELSRTPFYPQEDYQCGPAALATILVEAGVLVAPEDLTKRIYIPARKGSLQIEILAATRSLGTLPYIIDPTPAGLMAELAAGRPVLVLQNLGYRFAPVWHYAVVVGYDAESDEFVLRSGRTKRKLTQAAKFVATWQDSGNWGIVALRPGDMPANPVENRYLSSVAAMEGAGQIEPAKAGYLAALQRWSQSSTAMFGLANTYYATGDLGDAERWYRRLLENAPHDIAIRNNLAQVLLDQGRCGEALEVVNNVPSSSMTQPNLSDAFVDTRKAINEHCATGL